MPRRALGGNRELIEQQLGPELVSLVGLLCARRRVPASEWLRVPDLASVFATHAALSLAADLEAEGYGQTQARETAALRLGLEPSTLHSRLSRSRGYVRLRAA
jgi:hypothetical protein